MISLLTRGSGNYLILTIGTALAFFGTILALTAFRKYLPADHGREYAVNGELSKGKARGAGIIFSLFFALSVLLFVPASREMAFYLILLLFEMATGYLDDASATSWNEYKKGLLDLLCAALITVVYMIYNDTKVTLALSGVTFTVPKVLFFILAVILVWASVNVTNCTDGVDGLCTSLSLVVLAGMYMAARLLRADENFFMIVPILMAVLVGYLWYNAEPSSMLMGDAGSRLIGATFAIGFLKMHAPFLFLLLALVVIVDGGIGLVKVSLKRFLKIKILVNVTTPLHDNMRRKDRAGWSNTQVVMRFTILQTIISIISLLLIAARLNG